MCSTAEEVGITGDNNPVIHISVANSDLVHFRASFRTANIF